MQALQQLSAITPAIYRDQVVPFLSPDLAAYHAAPDAWNRMKEQVRANLSLALAPDTS
jgi:hypothetical protein